MNETDAAWIEHIAAVFQVGTGPLEDPKADRIGERVWKRLLKRYEAEKIDK